MSTNIRETFYLKGFIYSLGVQFYKIELILNAVFDIPQA